MAKDSAGRKMPWLKLWVKEFIGDPTVQGLPWDKRGRFIWAVFCSWDTDNPGLGEEWQWAAWMGYNPETWEDAVSDFLPLFRREINETGQLWVQKRLRHEYMEAKADSDKRYAASVAGNTAKYLSGRGPAGDRIGVRAESPSASATAVASESKETPTPPTPSVSRSRARRGGGSLLEPNQPPPPGVLVETWKDWFSFRASINKPLTELSAKMCAKKLSGFYEGGHDPDEILQTSIANGWQGVFVPREELTGRNGHAAKTDAYGNPRR